MGNCLPLPKDIPEVQELFFNKEILIEQPIVLSSYEFPETITVRVTGESHCKKGLPYEIIEVDFKEYVKSVIVNEWGANWTELESLKAGAMAIKTYALYQYERGGKYGGYENGIVFDCNWDMVYNPNIRRPLGDQAVDETWDYIMTVDGEIFQSHFLAWHINCKDWLGKWGTCMGIWNTYKDAQRGMTWQEILQKYYSNITIEQVYVRVNGERQIRQDDSRENR